MGYFFSSSQKSIFSAPVFVIVFEMGKRHKEGVWNYKSTPFKAQTRFSSSESVRNWYTYMTTCSTSLSTPSPCQILNHSSRTESSATIMEKCSRPQANTIYTLFTIIGINILQLTGKPGWMSTVLRQTFWKQYQLCNVFLSNQVDLNRF